MTRKCQFQVESEEGCFWMLLFDSYPESGRILLGRAKGIVCRRGYGLDFMRKTGQVACAYCHSDFTASYEKWLTMALDHVVPVSVCLALEIPFEWREDCSNKVLSCAACNGFRNRYKPTIEVSTPLTLDDFYDLRDHIFSERSKLIAESHRADLEFFLSRPWEQQS